MPASRGQISAQLTRTIAESGHEPCSVGMPPCKTPPSLPQVQAQRSCPASISATSPQAHQRSKNQPISQSTTRRLDLLLTQQFHKSAGLAAIPIRLPLKAQVSYAAAAAVIAVSTKEMEKGVVGVDS